MKILLVNKYNYVTGGADTYYFALRELLKSKGHLVAEFCMDSPENVFSEFSEYFVFGITSGNWKKASAIKSVKAFINSIYNFEAKAKFMALLEYFEPDIIHIQNIFYQISSSILSAAKKKRIPVVETLHDYHLICANNNFYHHGRICEDCLKHSRMSIIKNRCYNNSLRASLLAFTSVMIRKIFCTYESKISLWITPSRFLYEKIVLCGINSSKIRIVQCCIKPDEYEEQQVHDSSFILFLGRLEEQKGIWTLVKAAEMLSELKFIIAGDGSLKNEIAEYLLKKKIQNIKLTGFLKQEEVKKLISAASIIAVPSEWYEVFGLVIAEAFRYSKPVIASNIGGIPEAVQNNMGILFEPGNTVQLSETVRKLYYNRELREKLSQAAKDNYKKGYSEDDHYEKIMNIYKEAIYSYGKSQ